MDPVCIFGVRDPRPAHRWICGRPHLTAKAAGWFLCDIRVLLHPLLLHKRQPFVGLILCCRIHFRSWGNNQHRAGSESFATEYKYGNGHGNGVFLGCGWSSDAIDRATRQCDLNFCSSRRSVLSAHSGSHTRKRPSLRPDPTGESSCRLMDVLGHTAEPLKPFAVEMHIYSFSQQTRK